VPRWTLAALALERVVRRDWSAVRVGGGTPNAANLPTMFYNTALRHSANHACKPGECKEKKKGDINDVTSGEIPPI